jgi:hypothetical protein
MLFLEREMRVKVKKKIGILGDLLCAQPSDTRFNFLNWENFERKK